MTSNDNLNSQNPRAQSQHADPDGEIVAAGQSTTASGTAARHNPALLPESYLQASNPEQYDRAPDELITGEQAALAAAAAREGRVPTLRKPEERPIDCTVQMRGRTKNSLPIGADVPWEKQPEPEEQEEKISPLPVPPPPSSTATRLAAMKMPGNSELLQSQVEQAASSNFDAQIAIQSPRQAVRYKPAGAGNAAASPMPSSSLTPQMKPQDYPEETPPEPAPRKKRTDLQFYAEEEGYAVPSRTRVNPNLLKTNDDTTRRTNNYLPGKHGGKDGSTSAHMTGSIPKFSWSEMQYLLKFYIKEVRSLLVNPAEFYEHHTNDTTLGEPITFMILSGGIAAVFMSLSGDVGGGMSTLFGTSAYSIIAAIAVHYAMDFMNASNEPKGDLASTFKIMAYSQAPLLVAWIKLGSVPVGWWAAFVYTIYLCVIGLERVYQMDRQKSLMIMLVVACVIHGLLHLIGL